MTEKIIFEQTPGLRISVVDSKLKKSGARKIAKLETQSQNFIGIYGRGMADKELRKKICYGITAEEFRNYLNEKNRKLLMYKIEEGIVFYIYDEKMIQSKAILYLY